MSINDEKLGGDEGIGSDGGGNEGLLGDKIDEPPLPMDQKNLLDKEELDGRWLWV